MAPRIIRSPSTVSSFNNGDSSTGNSYKSDNGDSESLPGDWETRVNSAWENRDKESISGQSAAREAAKILGFRRLRDSIFPTLDKLLDASKLLRSNWSRDKNSVIKNK